MIESRSARTLRPSQSDTFTELQGRDHVILNSPTGWGKTTVLNFLAADRLRKNPAAKVVVIVPQRIISRGFVASASLRFPNGDSIPWRPLDLCEATSSKVDRLVAFLTRPAAGHRIVVTTHAGFTAAYAKLSKEASRSFRDTIVVVDESHHIQAGDVDAKNRLGHAVSHLLSLGVPIWLATAFFFRGDKTDILEKDQLARFQRVFIPLDKHLGEMQHTKSYTYDFVAYKQTVFPEVEALIAKSQPPTLIYCPPSGHPALGQYTKEYFVERIVKHLLQNYPGSSSWHPGLPGNARNVILDLTGTSERSERVEYLHENGDQVGVILTVGMMREGADWPPCARVLDLVPSSSDQERNQKFGRLLRDHPGKTTVRYYSFLPFLLDQSDERHRVEYSRLFAHFHASLILDNALQPIKVPACVKSTPKRNGKSENQKIDLLGQFSADRQREIEEAVSVALVCLAAFNEEQGRGMTWEEASSCILETLIQLKCGDDVGDDTMKALRDQVVLLWRRRRSPTLDVGDLVEQGFDKIWSPDALEPLKLFAAGHCGMHTFSELRAVLGNGGQVEAEKWARRCATRYAPGHLPSLLAKNSEGRSDAQKITSLRMSKKGNGRNTWYPTVETIFHDAGHIGAFDSTDHQAEAEQWARACSVRYKPGHLPTGRSKHPMERSDGKRIERLKYASRGTHGRAKAYSTVQAIFTAAGHVGVFASTTDRQSEAEEWARQCAVRYAPNQLPSTHSKLPEMRRDGQKIHNMRMAKRGLNRGTFYPSVESIFNAAGHFGVFDRARATEHELQQS